MSQKRCCHSQSDATKQVTRGLRSEDKSNTQRGIPAKLVPSHVDGPSDPEITFLEHKMKFSVSIFFCMSKRDKEFSVEYFQYVRPPIDYSCALVVPQIHNRNSISQRSSILSPFVPPPSRNQISESLMLIKLQKASQRFASVKCRSNKLEFLRKRLALVGIVRVFLFRLGGRESESIFL
jgi:hypothetical protein